MFQNLYRLLGLRDEEKGVTQGSADANLEMVDISDNDDKIGTNIRPPSNVDSYAPIESAENP